MKKLDEIKNVNKFEVKDNSIFILLDNSDLVKRDIDSQETTILKSNVIKFELYKEYLICQEKENSDIFILGINGQEIRQLNGTFNLCYKNPNEKNLLLITEDVDEKQKLILIDKNLDQQNINSNLYGHTIDNKLLYAFKDSICCYDVYNGEIIWKVTIENLSIKDFEPVASKILVVRDSILFASNEKKLLCLSLASGEFKWLNESIASGWSFTNNRLYGTYGKYIVEIDFENGKELRKYHFEESDLLPNYSAMYKLWSTPDWLLCVDSENDELEGSGVVRILKRENFETTFLYNSKSFIRGYDENVFIKKDLVCLLDSGNSFSRKILTVFQIDHERMGI